MTNLVDTSMETVNAEFDAAEQEIGTEAQAEAAQAPPEPDPVDEAQRQAEIAMATGMIATSMRFAIGSFADVTVDDTLTQQAAESYAVLIIKYYPGGIFGLLDKYKEELAAATTTFVLIRAVSQAKAKKAEEEEAERKAQAKPKQTPEAQPSEPSESTEGVALHG